MKPSITPMARLPNAGIWDIIGFIIVHAGVA